MLEEIKRSFLNNRSINKTVEETGYNKYKVRRALLTLGLWESGRSNEIKAMMEQGLTKEEIAMKLHLSIKGLESYLPYSRGAYLEEETSDGKDSRNYRRRKKDALEKQVKSNIHDKGDEVFMDDVGDAMEAKVYRIKLTLVMGEDAVKVLRRFRKAKEGISRTLLVPSSMQLNRLNYAIQKCFGWENSHLHSFSFREERFEELTKGGELEEWRSLAGVYFRCYDVTSDEDDTYYLDDYDGRHSFKTWLKGKYSSPYLYNPESERYEVVQERVRELEIMENGFWRWMHEKEPDRYPTPAKLDNLRYTLAECGGMELLERLPIKEVFSLDREFLYRYDPGDGWEVVISLEEEYGDSENAEASEMDEMVRRVESTLAPICVRSDGCNVLDDVGGIYGFCEFLKGLNGIENSFGYEPSHIEWARRLGWRNAVPKAEKIL